MQKFRASRTMDALKKKKTPNEYESFIDLFSQLFIRIITFARFLVSFTKIILNNTLLKYKPQVKLTNPIKDTISKGIIVIADAGRVITQSEC